MKDKLTKFIKKIAENPKEVFHFIGFLLISSIISFGIYETSTSFVSYLDQAKLINFYIYSGYDPIAGIFVFAETLILARGFFSSRFNPEKPINILWNFITIFIALTVVYVGAMIVIIIFFDLVERILEMGGKYYTWSWMLVIFIVSLKLNIVAGGLKTYRNNPQRRTVGNYLGIAFSLLFFLIGMAYVFVYVFNLFFIEFLMFSMFYKLWHAIFLFVLEIFIVILILNMFLKKWIKHFLFIVAMLFLSIAVIFTVAFTYYYYIEKNMTPEERCIEKKRGVACYGIAIKYVKDEKLVDPENFLKWSEKACEYKYIPACVSLAHFWYFGDGGKVDKEKSFKYASAVCEKAPVVLIGSEVEKVTPESDKYWLLEACGFLASKFYAIKDGKKMDFEKAMELGKLACDHGVESGCIALKIIEAHKKTKNNENKEEK